MQSQRRLGENDREKCPHYLAGRFSTIPLRLVKYLAAAQVGRNGFAVILVLCRHVYADGRFKKISRAQVSEDSGLTLYQVSRGMAELKEKLVIEPVKYMVAPGICREDRSNFGHVASYRFTRDAWEYIQADIRY